LENESKVTDLSTFLWRSRSVRRILVFENTGPSEASPQYPTPWPLAATWTTTLSPENTTAFDEAPFACLNPHPVAPDAKSPRSLSSATHPRDWRNDDPNAAFVSAARPEAFSTSTTREGDEYASPAASNTTPAHTDDEDELEDMLDEDDEEDEEDDEEPEREDEELLPDDEETDDELDDLDDGLDEDRLDGDDELDEEEDGLDAEDDDEPDDDLDDELLEDELEDDGLDKDADEEEDEEELELLIRSTWHSYAPMSTTASTTLGLPSRSVALGM
jgi:hypothetical protein